MASDFVLSIGDRLYDISAEHAPADGTARQEARVRVVPVRGSAGLPGRPVVRIAPRGQASLVTGQVDYAAAENLLADSAFWSGLDRDDAARLADLAIRIRDELSGGRPGAEALAGAWALELVVLATRMGERSASGRRPWKAPDGVWSIADVVRHIELNYADTFCLDWFVDKCAMNVTDFSRRFKERAGYPLFEFINRQRVARACALLKSSGLSIIEISEAVGYNNLSFFNRYFLRIAGVSPREYRTSAR